MRRGNAFEVGTTDVVHGGVSFLVLRHWTMLANLNLGFTRVPAFGLMLEYISGIEN